MLKAESVVGRSRNSKAPLWGLLLLLVLPGCQREANTESQTVHVFAAVSLKEAMEAIGVQFEAMTGLSVSFNFAGSNVLAQQIDASSRADLFISADSRWMDFLQERGKLGENTRVDFLKNALVAVCSHGAGWTIEGPEELCGLDFKFLCIGDPEAVPAGKYARDWFSEILCGETTVWETVRGRVSPAPDVRAALAQVSSLSDSIGVVYRTDYLLYKDKLKLLFDGPVEVSYPAAMTGKGLEKLAAGRFFTFLQSEESRSIFEKFGFMGDSSESE